MLLTRCVDRLPGLEQDAKSSSSNQADEVIPTSRPSPHHSGWKVCQPGNPHPVQPLPPYMATENGSPSTRPGSGGDSNLRREAANGHRPQLEVKEELPEPGEIVPEAQAQECPLDFSVKRRSLGLFSESLTDDSQASSSASSPPLHSSLRRLGESPAPPEEQSPYPYNEKATSSPPGLQGLEYGRLGDPQAALGRDSGPSSPHLQLPPGLPGFPPGGIPTNGSKMGALPNLGNFLDPRRTPGGGSKSTRPFKAYPREALSMPVGFYGMPGMVPFSGMEGSVLQNLSISSDEIMNIYKQQLQILRERDKQIAAMARANSMMNGASPRTTSGGSSGSNSSGGHGNITSMAPGPNTTGTTSSGSPVSKQPPSLSPPRHSQVPSTLPTPPSQPTQEVAAQPPPVPPSHRPMPPPLTPSTPSTPTTPTSKSTPPLCSPFSEVSKGSPTMVPPASSASATLVSSTSCSSNARKRPRTLPEEHKDEAYWERRRKNNEAAKRSRDARRAKEDEIAIRAALLEQENLKLRVEVAALKTETARLRCLLYNS